jgi:hypothetical protein
MAISVLSEMSRWLDGTKWAVLMDMVGRRRSPALGRPVVTAEEASGSGRG